MKLYNRVTTFPETAQQTTKAWWDPLLKEQHWSTWCQSLQYGDVKVSLVPDIKTSDTGNVNVGFWWKLGTQEWLIALKWGSLKSRGHKLSSLKLESRTPQYSSHPSVLNREKAAPHSRDQSCLHQALPPLCTGSAFLLGQFPLRISTTGLSYRRQHWTTCSQ